MHGSRPLEAWVGEALSGKNLSGMPFTSGQATALLEGVCKAFGFA